MLMQISEIMDYGIDSRAVGRRGRGRVVVGSHMPTSSLPTHALYGCLKSPNMLMSIFINIHCYHDYLLIDQSECSHTLATP